MTKPGEHFLTLDGLRGVAATAVVAHHGYRLLAPEIEQAHPWLAVDFFFCLSGFVIAHAYAERLAAGMGIGTFLKLRIRRLAPLFLLGMVLGIAFVLPQAFFGTDEHRILAQHTLPGIIGLIGLPAPPIYGLDVGIYPINNPSWSLLYEILANLAFALVWRAGGGGVRQLLPWLLAAAILLIAVAFLWPNLNYGASWDATIVGVARISWSFPLGVLLYRIYRAGYPRRIAVPAPVLIVATTACLLLPTPQSLSTAFELFDVLIAFPVIILLGARARSGPRLAKIETWLGASSYPLYITHYPLFLFYGGIVSRLARTPAESLAPWAGIGLVVLTHAFAILAYRFYDVPVRRWLANRSAPKTAPETAARPIKQM